MILPTGTPVTSSGCCIRFDRTTEVNGVTVGDPYIHHNSAHACVGVTEVTIVAGDLRIHFDQSMPIVTMSAVFDETMCTLGWDMGLSGGVGYANLRFSKDGVTRPATDPELYGAFRNIWVSFTHLTEAP